MQNVELLANAIVKRACDDWMEGEYKKRKGRKYNGSLLSSCENFFSSDWFQLLTDSDPKYLIAELDKEVDRRASGARNDARRKYPPRAKKRKDSQ